MAAGRVMVGRSRGTDMDELALQSRRLIVVRFCVTAVAAVCFFPSPAESYAEAGRPAATVVPAQKRLSGTLAEVRAAVRELDGRARVPVLVAGLAAARKADHLVRWALELQSVVHDENGNYLFRFYLALHGYSRKRARAFAELLAGHGIALGPSSGHFQRLDHLDPSETLPPRPAHKAARASIARWIDAFVSVTYDPSYKPRRKGALSELLQLTYADGGKLDVDIRLICDNYDPAPVHAMAHAYIVPGGRLFPLRLGRSTTPKLWRAKHEKALAAMYRSNREYEELVGIATAGIMTTLPLGLVVPVQPPMLPRAPAPRTASVRARTAARPASPAPSARPAPERHPSTIKTSRYKVPWPPKPPQGSKPAHSAPGAAEWRYQRYLHRAHRQGKRADQVQDFATWKRRNFDTAKRGGRPGRPGSKAHQADVNRNNKPNRIREGEIGGRFPDGVGRPGQVLEIRGRKIAPVGRGRVIVESARCVRDGTMPQSRTRAQLRDVRRARPGATIVVTDPTRPKAAPLIYPPGKQPPPPGPLPSGQASVVPYP